MLIVPKDNKAVWRGCRTVSIRAYQVAEIKHVHVGEVSHRHLYQSRDVFGPTIS